VAELASASRWLLTQASHPDVAKSLLPLHALLTRKLIIFRETTSFMVGSEQLTDVDDDGNASGDNGEMMKVKMMRLETSVEIGPTEGGGGRVLWG